MTETYILSQVAKASGVSPRTLQFWTSNGVIKPDPETLFGGPGTPRRYSREEVEIATVLGELNTFNVQIRVLNHIADGLRSSMNVGTEHGFSSGKEAIDAANADQVRYIREEYEDLVRPLKSWHPEIPDAPSIFNQEERWRLKVWGAFEEARHGNSDHALIVSVNKSGVLNLSILSKEKGPEKREPIDDLLAKSSCIVIGLGTVLSNMAKALED
jgi:DNA-binding transcriptional MerR regulator